MPRHRLTQYKLDDTLLPAGHNAQKISAIAKLAILFHALTIPAIWVLNSFENQLVVLAALVSYLTTTAMMASWFGSSIGPRIAYYLGSVVPVIATFYISHPAGVKILGGRFQITSVPLLLCATVLPFAFLRIVLNAKLGFPGSDNSTEALKHRQNFTVLDLMATTMIFAFAFAVLTSGDTENHGVIWELVPIMASTVAAMFLGVLAAIALTIEKQFIPICLALATILAVYCLATVACEETAVAILVTLVAVAWLVLPVAGVRLVGVRLLPLEIEAENEPQLKRPIHRLD